MLRNDAVKLCQENNFNTGFFEGSDNNCVVDAYELKVIILFKSWHILRISCYLFTLGLFLCIQFLIYFSVGPT